MRLQNWWVIIAMAIMMVLALSAYYQTVAQTATPTERALGFEVITSPNGEQFFAVLMADRNGVLKVNVYDSKGEQSGRIILSEPKETAPVRVLPPE
jgi:hypothetical protein